MRVALLAIQKEKLREISTKTKRVIYPSFTCALGAFLGNWELFLNREFTSRSKRSLANPELFFCYADHWHKLAHAPRKSVSLERTSFILAILSAAGSPM